MRCSGVYSYRIADPLLFYTNVCGNVEREYRRETLEGQLKTEFISALQTALINIIGTEEGKEIFSVYSHTGYAIAQDSDYDAARQALTVVK